MPIARNKLTISLTPGSRTLALVSNGGRATVDRAGQ